MLACSTEAVSTMADTLRKQIASPEYIINLAHRKYPLPGKADTQLHLSMPLGWQYKLLSDTYPSTSHALYLGFGRSPKLVWTVNTARYVVSVDDGGLIFSETLQAVSPLPIDRIINVAIWPLR